MSKKPNFLSHLEAAMLLDVALFITAMLLIVFLSVSSLSNAYMLAIALFAGLGIAIHLYRRHRSTNAG